MFPGMLNNLQEDERFYFDAEAADRPCRFIETYLEHFQGAHAGKPFLLHPVQRKIVRDIYGWKWRDTGLRRFTDVWLEGAVGCGKSPLMAALGLYGLMADGEPAAQVYSLASKFSQARIVFDCAKRFARGSRELARRLNIIDREIRHPRSGSVWKIVGRTGPGAGCSPSMVLGDEAHDWTGADAYRDLRDRMAKRRQPLMIVATNAGATRASLCWQMHERAAAALNGKGDPALYPVIWAAPEDANTDDPNAWAMANPLLGVTIDVETVRRAAIEAMKDEEEEAIFRRLYLGIWPNSSRGRWLNLGDWDACVSAERPPAGTPCYVGLDMSLGDDLCAAVYVWVTPEQMYVGADFWIPKATATRYEAKDGIPYKSWSDMGHVHLLDESTITPAVRRRIANRIIERATPTAITAVCYDRYNADDAVAAIEAAGVRCVPVPQGYTLSPGCQELERRLTERSIAIVDNHVLRWCAENAEVKTDDRGNIWPAKPNAKGKYAGTRANKIDGITALVTAMVEARKHSFPAARKRYAGTICTA